MREYLPLLIVCAVIGVFTILFLAAYAVLKRKTKAETSERHMSDSEIIKRLLGYARPYKKDFVLVFLIMLVSIAYDVVSPLLVADIQGTIKQSFELSLALFAGCRVRGHSGGVHGLHLFSGHDPAEDRPENSVPDPSGHLHPH